MARGKTTPSQCSAFSIPVHNRAYTNRAAKETLMQIGNMEIGPLAALIAGILILVAPRLLNYIVAIWLIIFGVTGLGILS
jgi:hypothetical protein